MNKRIVYSYIKKEAIRRGFTANEKAASIALNSFFDKIIDKALDDCIVSVPNQICFEAITRSSINEVYNDLAIYCDGKDESYYFLRLNEKIKEKVNNNKKNYRYVYQ